MRHVISNNTPLRYLVFLGYERILPALFTRLIIPRAVVDELQRPKTPVRVRSWMATPPSWVDIRQPSLPPDALLLQLGIGERDAILLALELHADLLLIDERDGRREAEQRALQVIGTLRVLEMAAERDLLDLPTAITHLRETTFYMPEDVVSDMLARDAARKRQES